VLGHVDEILPVSVLPLHLDAHLASAHEAQGARETTGRNPRGPPQVGVDGELGLAGHRGIEHVLHERVAAGVGRRRPPPPQCAQSAW
jgi:hypothetical protein